LFVPHGRAGVRLPGRGGLFPPCGMDIRAFIYVPACDAQAMPASGLNALLLMQPSPPNQQGMTTQ